MTEDVRLIDDAVAALASLDWPAPLRRSPTQLVLGVQAFNAFIRDGAYIDAREETVYVTCYPCSPVPEERLHAVAELMNLMACTGVNFALALDLASGQVKLCNHACFVGTTADRQPLLRDVIGEVVNAVFVYGRPLYQVAFEQVVPAAALAELEQWIVASAKLRTTPTSAFETHWWKRRKQRKLTRAFIDDWRPGSSDSIT